MKLKLYTGLVLLSFILSIASCKKSDEKDKPLKAEEIIDESYGVHADNTLDTYLPENRSDTTKVLILLHGGSWYEGDKEDLTELAMYLRDKGFAVVNMNYRLTGSVETIHPAQEQDITAAVNYAVSKAPDWNVSSEKFGILGVSAGAHLALLYTYGYNANNKIKTVISLSGPTNFTDTRGIGSEQAAAVEALLGYTFQDNPELYVETSPIAKAGSLSKPTLLIHGTEDLIVPVQQAIDLHNKLELVGVKNEIMLQPTGHELYNDTNKQEILDKIEQWFWKNIK